MSCDRVAEHEQVSSVRDALPSAFQDDNGERIQMCTYGPLMLASFYCQTVQKPLSKFMKGEHQKPIQHLCIH